MGAIVSTSGSAKRGSFDTNADMNIIPFIDILLVLLIIFMVAAPVPTTDVKVDLPPPVPPPPDNHPKKPTVVDVRDDGTGNAVYFVDGALTTRDALPDTVLAHIKINVPDTQNRLLEVIRVRADQTLPYGEVMGTMALLQEKDFQTISLVAESAIDESQLRQ